MRSLAPLKIGYFADGIWSHNAFRKIIAHKDFHICFITPRFDSTDETLKLFAKTHNIPYIKAQNINSPEFLEQIKPFECDIFVSMSFNQIFKEPLISTPRLHTINCHAGKLPFYRGRNILNWALINDEKEFGISVHYVDSGIDTGDLILQRTYPINDKDDYSTLLHTAHTECAEVLFNALCLLHSGKAERIPQKSIHEIGFYCPARIKGDEWIEWHKTSREIFNFALCLLHSGKAERIPQKSIHEIGFYCPARIKGDEWIEWHKTSREIFNFIRALNTPDLGAKTRTNTQELRIFKAQEIKNAPHYIATPGCVVGVEKALQNPLESIAQDFVMHDSTTQDSMILPHLIVKTLDSTLRITQYQCAKALKIGDRLLGYNFNGGGATTQDSMILPHLIVKTLDSTLRITQYQCAKALKIGDRLLGYNFNGGGVKT